MAKKPVPKRFPIIRRILVALRRLVRLPFRLIRRRLRAARNAIREEWLAG